MDRFHEMLVFTTIVDTGNFVGAADALLMSKAAVSRLIGNLEARLGVRLLHRTTRRLSLTDEGQVFYIRCKTILADVDEAEAEITVRSGQARGSLKVSAPVSFGLQHLAPLWGEFMAQNPQVTLDINLSDRVVDLVDEGFDLAVRIGHLKSSSLISRQLSSTRMVLCASPRYLKKHGSPSHPSELANHAVLAYSLSAMGEQWEFSGPEGLVTVKVAPQLRTNNGETCRHAALQDRGIVLQPSFVVGQDLKMGDLVEILPEYRSADLGIYAVYASRQHVSPKIRILIDYLHQALGLQTW